MMVDARRRLRPMRLSALLLAICLSVSSAWAEDDVAVVNAAGPGSAGQLVKLRKRLDAMGALRVTRPEVEAALGGEGVDVGPIKEAFERFDYDRAEELLEQGITDLLTSGDPRMAVPLAELLHWRGLIADELDDGGEAEMWFAASYRLDPERVIDQEATPPRVRKVIEKARRAKGGVGRIEVSVEEDATVEVDGRRATEEVAAGMHLVVVTAPERSPFAKLVRVPAGKTVAIDVEMSPESEVARARRARDAIVAARTDKLRLKKARPLAQITGARKLIVIEGEDELTVRVFDLDARTVSAPVALREASRPAVLAEMLGMEGTERRRDKQWFERWYVWVGVAAVAGGGYATWEMTHRDPTSLRGF